MQSPPSCLGRWFVAAALAVGGIGLTARAGAAKPIDEPLGNVVITEISSSSSKCLTNDNGNPYTVYAVAFDAHGNVLCNGGAIAATTGASAEMLCNGGAAPATLQISIAGFDSAKVALDIGGTNACVQEGAWGSEVTCSMPADVTSSCPANNTIIAVGIGRTSSN
jgi:hypothetical protein